MTRQYFRNLKEADSLQSVFSLLFNRLLFLNFVRLFVRFAIFYSLLQCLLLFLLDYPLGKKLQGYLEFYVSQLG